MQCVLSGLEWQFVRWCSLDEASACAKRESCWAQLGRARLCNCRSGSSTQRMVEN